MHGVLFENPSGMLGELRAGGSLLKGEHEEFTKYITHPRIPQSLSGKRHGLFSELPALVRCPRHHTRGRSECCANELI